MWDNRAKKASGQYKANRADFSCKDKDGCGKGVWLKDQESAGRVQATNGSAPRSAPHSTAPLGPVYADCLDFAKRAVHHYAGDMPYTMSDVIAAAATLFIQATKENRPLTAPKVKPTPPPPPPRPEPEPDYTDLRTLPF